MRSGITPLLAFCLASARAFLAIFRAVLASALLALMLPTRSLLLRLDGGLMTIARLLCCVADYHAPLTRRLVLKPRNIAGSGCFTLCLC